MKSVSSFFKIYKKIKAPEKTIKKIFTDSVFKYCGIKIKEEDVYIKNSAITINTKSVIKQEVLFYKKDILKYVNNSTNKFFKEIY